MVETTEHTDNGPYTLQKHFRHDEEYARLPRKKPWQKHVLNLDDGTFLDRTAVRWVLILLFFLVFYTLLAGFCYFSYWVFEGTIDPDVPKVPMPQPGFSFAPATVNDSIRLIEYSPQIYAEVDEFTDAISSFLGKFDKKRDDRFGPCTEKNEFGFSTTSPCIFLKVNRLIGFKVKPYTSGGQLPKKAPSSLRLHVDSLPPDGRQRIWISCMSKSNLKFEFYPDPSVPIGAVHFPKKVVRDQKDPERGFFTKADLQRVVAVRILKVPYGKRHLIKCFQWAKNIEIDEYNEIGKGMVRFDLRVLKTT